MIKIRLFEDSDISAIVALENQHFNPVSEQDFNEYYVHNSLMNIYIIEVCNALIGYASIWLDKEKYQIYSMLILEAYRGKGFAYKSLTEIEKLLEEQGVMEASLEVRESNLKAIGLYEKLGYKTISRRKAYYDNQEDALFMYKLVGK